MKAKEISQDIERYDNLMSELDELEDKVVDIRREMEQIRVKYKGVIEF